MTGRGPDFYTTPEGLTYPVDEGRLVLPASGRDEIIAAGRAGLPNEACGLVAGAEEGGVATVERVYVLPNQDASPEHFTIAPADQLAALRDMRLHGLAPLGNWHSHPATPARPSQEDVRLARDPAAHYLILSLAQDEPVLRAFRVRDEFVYIEPIVVKED